ncbi:MAG: flagellar biosynthetic protein FliR [Anaerosolibacter sp.]|uniref:flagellar biosynthetic protein FliR n=1 Tax=Anaerosolibacter sp. TaxID=1872527 RepID=UPI002601A673|nr:flagellar biosynthetic protein FliR [Anaerosolibacter sp.]MDF2545854.1 flagellar biosynthetic protein FliR [Anaerosolibacter sp.]
MEIIELLLDQMGILLLIFARIVGMLMTAPIFNQNNIPAYVKLGFSLILAFILLPILAVPTNLQLENFFQLMLLGTKELALGIMIGFICYLFFSIVYIAGHLIDMEIGFSIASVLNPMDENEEIALSANLIFVMAILVFLSVNGHHKLIQVLKQSFDIIPIGGLTINGLMIEKLISIFISIFVIAFKFSAPIIVAIFLTNVLLGILARTMPQMNVFVVGMPIKILLGMMVLFIVFPLYIGFFEYIFDTMFEHLWQLLHAIVKG